MDAKFVFHEYFTKSNSNIVWRPKIKRKPGHHYRLPSPKLNKVVEEMVLSLTLFHLPIKDWTIMVKNILVVGSC